MIRHEKKRVQRDQAAQAKDPWKLLRKLSKKSVMTSVLKDTISGQK